MYLLYWAYGERSMHADTTIEEQSKKRSRKRNKATDTPYDPELAVLEELARVVYQFWKGLQHEKS